MPGVFQETGVRAVVKGAQKYISDINRLGDATNKTFSGAVGNANRQADTFQQKMGGIGRSAGIAGGALTAGLTLPIIGLGAASIKMGLDFEKQMTNIAALTNTPNEAIGGLRKQILDLSREVAVSPAELGAGAYFILSSGITDTATAMAVLEHAAKASAAGLGDTATIAATTTSIMNAYGFSAAEAERATDALTNTVKLGKGEPAELANSLGFIIPIASQMGISVEQVGGVLATLTNVGLGADNAVTALKGALTQVLSPSDQSRDAFRRLGAATGDAGFSVEVFRQRVQQDMGAAFADLVKKAGAGSEALTRTGLSIEDLSKIAEGALNNLQVLPKDVEGTFNRLADSLGLSLTEVAELVGVPADALANLSASEATSSILTLQASLSGADATLAELFPDVRGLTGVLGAFGVQAGATASNIDAMEKGVGATAKAFDEANDSAPFKLRQALIDLQVSLTELGLVLIPVLITVLDALKPAFKAFATGIEIFSKMPKPLQLLIIGFVALVAAIGPVLLIIGAMASAVVAVSAAAAILGPLLAGIGLVVLPLVLPILAVVAALVALAAVAYLVYKNWDELVAFFTGLGGRIIGAVGDLAGWFKEHWKDIVKGILLVLFPLPTLIATNFGKIKGAVSKVFKSIGDVIEKNWKKALNLVLLVLFPIPFLVVKHFDKMKALVLGSIKSLSGDAVKLFNKMVSGIVSAAKGVISGVLDQFSKMANAVINAITSFISTITGFFAALPGKIVKALGNLVSSVVGVFVGLGSGLIGQVTGTIGNIVGMFTGLPGKIVGAIESGLSAVYNAGKGLLQALFDGMVSAAGVGADFGRQIANAVIDAVNSVFGTINDALDFEFEIPIIGQNVHVDAPDIPPILHLYRGTPRFGGGLAMVGEMGPELVKLPAGAAVLSATRTRSLASDAMGSLSSLVTTSLGLTGRSALASASAARAAASPTVSVAMPVTVNVEAMDWRLIRAAIHREVDAQLSDTRNTSVRQGMPLATGLS